MMVVGRLETILKIKATNSLSSMNWSRRLGRNFPKTSYAHKPRNRNTTNDPVSLSSPKGGEGRGEEAFRVHGEEVRMKSGATRQKISSNMVFYLSVKTTMAKRS